MSMKNYDWHEKLMTEAVSMKKYNRINVYEKFMNEAMSMKNYDWGNVLYSGCL